MQTKEFLNKSHQQYYNVSKGTDVVSIKNFGDLYHLLPSSEIMFSSREVIGRSLLDSLRYVDRGVSFADKDYNNFISFPTEFNKKYLSGSDADNELKDLKNMMALINELFGHYSVSVELVNFLIQRNNVITNKYNSLLRDYEVALVSLAEKDVAKKIDDLKIVELKKTEVNPIVLTTEEKKEDKVEIISADKIIDENDDEEVISEEDEQKDPLTLFE